jgi:hypothetical protein
VEIGPSLSPIKQHVHGSGTSGDHSTQKTFRRKGRGRMSIFNLDAKRAYRRFARLLSILFVMLVIVPMTRLSESAELYAPRVHKKIILKRSFDYPYGGSYLIGTYYARHSLGSPYVGVYFGDYYPPYHDYYPYYSRALPCLKRTWACR